MKWTIDMDINDVDAAVVTSLLRELQKELSFFRVSQMAENVELGLVDLNVYGIESIDETSEAWAVAVRDLVWKFLGHFAKIEIRLSAVPEGGPVFVFDDEEDFDGLQVYEKRRAHLRLVQVSNA